MQIIQNIFKIKVLKMKKVQLYASSYIKKNELVVSSLCIFE